MKCLQPRRITKNLDPKKFPMGLLVPCGQCMNCRIQKREEWVLRLLHEMIYWDKYLFVTLTYSDEHLKKNNNLENPSLVKSDLQKFFKRLRKNSKRKLKYFAAGEYGEKEGRPHYHLIIFGLDFISDKDREFIKQSWEFCDWKMLGNKPFGSVTVQSMRYVVSYLEKSITGKWEEYAYEGIESPFHVVSNGLGKNFAMENAKTLEEDGFISVQGYKKGIPRYYTDVTGISRDKLKEHAIETEIEVVKSLTGLNLNRDDLYLFGTKDDNLKVENAVMNSNKQNDLNIHARIEINKRRRKRDT